MPGRQTNLRIASMYAILTSLVASLVAAATKYLTGMMDASVVVCIQYLICLFTLTPWMAKVGLPGLATQVPRHHLIRGVAGWACFYTYYLAIGNIPLVDASLLRNTAPICVPFFAYLLFRNRISLLGMVGIGLGFAGVLFILKPEGASFSLWHGIGFLSGVTLAVSMIYTRELAQSEPSNRILFYYFLISLLLSTPLALLNFTAIPLLAWPALLFVGFSIFITMKLYNHAYAHAPANSIAPLTYFGVVFAGLLGWLFWDHVPDGKSLGGMILIILGGVLAIMAKPAAEQSRVPKS
ncbi:DMT family transporter [Ketobacter sp.]|uniref:DMT family transporter n=1 Tax=Ketobacter sp. TaxID=2083498 RepID=UPI000F12032C|nr:DMT family transporter [Ketobacter sp.]RLT98593.1 MAG: DMT family transporter [Ketobacter sp.]